MPNKSFKQMDFRKCDTYIARVLERKEIPGMAWAFVTKDGFHRDSQGYAKIIDEKESLRIDSLFDLASVSKVTATLPLVLQAIEEGCFSLKTEVKSLLPAFPYEQINILELLTHTSGLAADDKRYKECRNKAELIDFIYKQPLVYPTGSKVEYSCFNFILLALIIEKFFGPLDEAAERRIFKPLGMVDTLYCPSKHGLAKRCVATEMTAERGLIRGEVHDGKAYRMGGVSGNAGVFSTVSDLAKYVMMYLNDGVFAGKRILSSSSIALLKKAYTAKLNLSRTLGWFFAEKSAQCGDYYSDCSLFHTGFTGTSIYIDFIRECGIILLTNRIHPTRNNSNIAHIRNELHNILLREYDDCQ